MLTPGDGTGETLTIIAQFWKWVGGFHFVVSGLFSGVNLMKWNKGSMAPANISWLTDQALNGIMSEEKKREPDVAGDVERFLNKVQLPAGNGQILGTVIKKNLGFLLGDPNV